jgi:hypothetical protein
LEPNSRRAFPLVGGKGIQGRRFRSGLHLGGCRSCRTLARGTHAKGHEQNLNKMGGAWDNQLRRGWNFVVEPAGNSANDATLSKMATQAWVVISSPVMAIWERLGFRRVEDLRIRHPHGRERIVLPGRTWVYCRHVCSQDHRHEEDRTNNSMITNCRLGIPLNSGGKLGCGLC